MKKLSLALCLLMFTGILFTSCNSKKGDAYTLKMRLNKGDKFNQNIDMNMTTSVTAMGMSKDVKMNMNMGSEFEVLDSTAAGKVMKITYTKMEMKMDMGTGAANSGMMDSIMKEQFKHIIGKSIEVTMSGNKIIEVKGMQELMSDSSASPAMSEAMNKMFSKDNLNSMFGMMFNMYPNKPVTVGETWTADNTMDMSGMNMTVKNTYKLLGVKDGVAEIGLDGTIDTKGKMKQGGMDMDMDMKGTQKGSMNAALDNGYIKDGKYDMDVTAEMNVMGQKMPMKMKATYTIKN